MQERGNKMDYMVRAMAADGAIRAFAATTKEITETARAAHNTSPVATAALGRTLTGAVMMGSMLKGEKDLCTLQLRGDGPLGGIVATADSAGHVKGYVHEPQVLIHANAKGKLDVAGAIGHGTLTVIKDMGLKEPYSGTVDLVSGEIAEDLTYYFASSEQVPSAVGLGVLMERDNTVRQAGGFIIQLMPFTPEDVVSRLEKKLAETKPVTTMLDEGASPEEILESLLGEFGLTTTEREEISFQCDCSEERVERALISVGADELESMIAEGKPIEVNCQFCGKTYSFDMEHLKTLLKKAVR